MIKRPTLTVYHDTPIGGSPFGAMDEDGQWLVVSDADEDFVMKVDNERAAYYAAELLNRGYRSGYADGDFKAKLAMRTALGLDVS